VLIEVLARGFFLVAVLVALDADPEEHVQEQHRDRGPDEHRADLRPALPIVVDREDDVARDEDQRGNAVAHERHPRIERLLL
jgi:hypothetical protein